MSIKQNYILDECCFLHAANLENEEGKICEIALKMLMDIVYNCHSILVSNKLNQIYLSNTIPKIKKARNSDSSLVIKIMRQLLPNLGKYKFWETEMFDIPINESNIPTDDRYLVRLAYISKATLVTADNRLINSLEPDENGYSEKYGIRVLNPMQTIADILRN